MKTELTNEEKAIIRALNFTACFDGFMTESEIKHILKEAIVKFIPKSRRHLVSVSETAYPIHIKLNNHA